MASWGERDAHRTGS